MRLVLDSNIIFAAILKNSTTRNILVSDEFEFFLSEYALVEIDKHRPYLVDKARVSDSAFKHIVNLLLERTTLVPDNTLAQYCEQASEIMKDIDPHDAAFLALALSFHNMESGRTTKTLNGNQLFVSGRRMSCLHSWKNESFDSASSFTPSHPKPCKYLISEALDLAPS